VVQSLFAARLYGIKASAALVANAVCDAGLQCCRARRCSGRLSSAVVVLLRSGCRRVLSGISPLSATGEVCSAWQQLCEQEVCNVRVTSTHTARVTGDSALLRVQGRTTRSLALKQRTAAEVCFNSLPDALIHGIVGRAWAQRPAQPAAAEVRSAVDLLSVCRRVRGVLLAQPLPLALDFTGAPLSKDQGKWLAADIRVGFVEAAAFHHRDFRLWRCADHRRFLARHGRSLQWLFGVPLRLVSSRDASRAPPLDLTSLPRLISLSILLPLRYEHIPAQEHVLLMRGSWPEALREVKLLSAQSSGRHVLRSLAWAPLPHQQPPGEPLILNGVHVVDAVHPGKLNERMSLDVLIQVLQGECANALARLILNGNVYTRIMNVCLNGCIKCVKG